MSQRLFVTLLPGMSPKLGLEQKLQQLFFEPEFNPLHVAHGKSILHMTYLGSVLSI